MINPWTVLEACGELSPEAKHSLIHAYQERGEKAILAVEHGNVKKYRDFWVVVGRSDEYIVEEDFCTCDDFRFRGGNCWHSLAVRIAEICHLYEEFDLFYTEPPNGDITG